MSNTELGGLIHHHRLAAGLSLIEVATKTAINKGTLYKIEQGSIERPNPEYLRKIARALGTEVEDSMSLAGYSSGLPSLTPYLRARYDVTPETASQVEAYLRFLQSGSGPTPSTTTSDDDSPEPS